MLFYTENLTIFSYKFNAIIIINLFTIKLNLSKHAKRIESYDMFINLGLFLADY